MPPGSFYRRTRSIPSLLQTGCCPSPKPAAEPGALTGTHPFQDHDGPFRKYPRLRILLKRRGTDVNVIPRSLAIRRSHEDPAAIPVGPQHLGRTAPDPAQKRRGQNQKKRHSGAGIRMPAERKYQCAFDPPRPAKGLRLRRQSVKALCSAQRPTLPDAPQR